EATMESDQLKLLGRSVGPVDAVVADAGSAGLKIFIDNPSAVGNVASVLSQAAANATRGARGPVKFLLSDAGLPGEVEIDLNEEFPVSPEIKGAIKSLDGILEVQEF
ncbi:MAG: hypothetical protein VX622_06745, partial [Pseudomonadota bacterium]|nr:hypothetical protein [Pseudomonadota bacterium]